jgi:hypothetical protein
MGQNPDRQVEIARLVAAAAGLARSSYAKSLPVIDARRDAYVMRWRPGPRALHGDAHPGDRVSESESELTRCVAAGTG